MKKFVNEIKIQGRVFNFGSTESRMLQVREAGPNSKNPGSKYMRGELNVAIDDEGKNVVPVWYQYEPELWPSKDGGPERENSKYNTLKRLIEEGACWESNGKDAAPIVSLKCEFETNVYFTQDEQMRTANRVRGGFINTMPSMSGDKGFATFNVGCVLVNTRLHDEDNDDSKRLELQGYAFNFRNEVQPFTFNMRNEAGIQYFIDQDISKANPMVTQIWGNINNIIFDREIVKESAFGDPLVEKVSTFIRSYDVTGATNKIYDFDDESTITKEEMRSLIKQFDERVERDREYRKNAAAAPKSPVKKGKPAPKKVATNDDDYDFFD